MPGFCQNQLDIGGLDLAAFSTFLPCFWAFPPLCRNYTKIPNSSLAGGPLTDQAGEPFPFGRRQPSDSSGERCQRVALVGGR